MRKWTILLVWTMPLLLLAGCGEREARLEKGFSGFRESLLEAREVTARAELTADAGGTLEEYSLDMVWDGQETVLTVSMPERIAGVRARARWGETTLEYGDVILGAGALNEDGLTPVSAVPAVLDAMAGGYVELLWWDGDYIAARLYVSDSSRCTVWLEEESLTPVSAEIAADGRRVITCTFTDWAVTPGGKP